MKNADARIAVHLGPRVVVVVSLLVVILLATTARAAMPSDAARTEINPTTAEVPTPPPGIVDPLTDAEYAKAYFNALQNVGPAPAAADAPMTGARIVSVVPDSPASKAALRVNDIIVAIDGKPTPTGDAAKAIHRAATQEQTLDVVPFDQPTHRLVKVNPGPVGVDVDDGWLLEAQYLHDLPAGVAPVDEVRVAAQCAVSDPALAASALAHAKKAGGPGTTGPMVDAIAAVALYNDAWFERALAYATAASKALPDDRKAQLEPIIVDSAIATFRFPLAETIARPHPIRYAAALATIASELDVFQQQEHTAPQPNPAASEVAATLTDHTSDAANLARHVNGEFESSQYIIWHMVNKATMPFKSPDGSYNLCECGPGGADVSFSADCHFAPSDSGTSGYVKVVRVGAVSDNRYLKLIELYVDGSANAITAVGAATARLNLSRLICDDRTFNLKMLMVGDRYEFVIDGRRVFYGPLPPPAKAGARDLTLCIQTVGVTGEFSHVSWRTSPAK